MSEDIGDLGELVADGVGIHAQNLLAQGLPPIRLITSSRERPCCMHHPSSRLISTGSGSSRDASTAISVYPMRFSWSTTYCLLYCSMTITKSLRQPDATVAHASGG